MTNHYGHHNHYSKLHIPDHWEHYWSKYPNGYTLLEALISWTSQVNDMITSYNHMSDDMVALDRNFRALEKELRASWKGYKDKTDLDNSNFRDEVYTIINNFIASIEPTIQDTVVSSLSTWLADGTLADIINNDVFDMKANQTDLDIVNERLDDNAINPFKYAGELTNHADIITNAFKYGNVIKLPNNVQINIDKEVEIPTGKKLDFNYTKIVFTGEDASFNISPGATLVNAKVLVSQGVVLKQAVLYFDGNKNFILGDNTATFIENVGAKRDGGENRYQGTFIHLDATQKKIDEPCFISGISFKEINSWRFEYGFRMTVSAMDNSDLTTYISANTVDGYTAYNPSKFIWEDDLTGTKTQLSDNMFSNLQCQADSTAIVFLRLVGRLSRFKNFIAWDYHRPSNQTDQFIILGSWHYIEGNIPNFDSPLIRNEGIYNTISSKNPGISTHFADRLISQQSMRTHFIDRAYVMPFQTLTSVVDVVGQVESQSLLDFSFPKNKISTGYAVLEFDAFGVAVAPSSRYYGMYVNGQHITSGRALEVGTINWQMNAKYIIRYYGDSVKVSGYIESTDGQMYVGTTTVPLSEGDEIHLELKFNTDKAGNMTCLGRTAQMTKG